MSLGLTLFIVAIIFFGCLGGSAYCFKIDNKKVAYGLIAVSVIALIYLLRLFA